MGETPPEVNLDCILPSSGPELGLYVWTLPVPKY